MPFLKGQLSGELLRSNPLGIILDIVLAFVLALVISWVYKRTHRGLSYSKSFVFTLVVLAPLVATVMLLIGNSLAKAFTLVGAFTIIRFRTAIKDTRDVAYIFWVLVTGMATGTGNYYIAVVSTVLVLAIVMFLSKTNFGSIRNYDHIVSFTIDTGRAPNDVYKSLFEKYLRMNSMLNVNSRQAGSKLEFTFNVAFLSDNQVANFVSELRGTPGVESVNLLTAKDDIEY